MLVSLEPKEPLDNQEIRLCWCHRGRFVQQEDSQVEVQHVVRGRWRHCLKLQVELPLTAGTSQQKRWKSVTWHGSASTTPPTWKHINVRLQATNPPTNQFTNQLTIQSTNHPIHQPSNPPTNQFTNQLTIQSTNQPIHQPSNPPTNQPSNPPTNQPINPSTNQPINRHSSLNQILYIETGAAHLTESPVCWRCRWIQSSSEQPSSHDNLWCWF